MIRSDLIFYSFFPFTPLSSDLSSCWILQLHWFYSHLRTCVLALSAWTVPPDLLLVFSLPLGPVKSHCPRYAWPAHLTYIMQCQHCQYFSFSLLHFSALCLPQPQSIDCIVRSSNMQNTKRRTLSYPGIGPAHSKCKGNKYSLAGCCSLQDLD